LIDVGRMGGEPERAKIKASWFAENKNNSAAEVVGRQGGGELSKRLEIAFTREDAETAAAEEEKRGSSKTAVKVKKNLEVEGMTVRRKKEKKAVLAGGGKPRVREERIDARGGGISRAVEKDYERGKKGLECPGRKKKGTGGRRGEGKKH